MSCPDRKGLVAMISDFIFRNGGNILHADQHTDLEEGVFLARMGRDLDGFKIPRERIGSHFQPLALEFGMCFQLFRSNQIQKVDLRIPPARAVRLHLSHRILTYGSRTVIFD
ncbi:MAG: hypothetical protein DMG57_16845 [Acidobacteria bacterium]|nr:MAG: hypothetical protein DMG57_16845 [Acidobacteriota bacterium]